MKMISRFFLMIILLALTAACSPIQAGNAPTPDQAATSAAQEAAAATRQAEAAEKAAAEATAQASREAAAATATQAYQATQAALETQKYWIAYSAVDLAVDDSGAYGIYAVRADGQGLRKLFHKAWQEGDFDISPDGSFIVLEGNEAGQQQSDIYRINLDGSDLKPLTSNRYNTEFAPRLSPDGSKVIFLSDQGLREIFLMNVDGTGATNLSASPARQNDGPRWSPDGSMLIYGSLIPKTSLGKNWNVDVKGMDTRYILYNVKTGARTTFPGFVAFDYSWSPDGSKIAVTCNHEKSSGEWASRLCTMDLPGGESRQVLELGTTEYESFLYPRWSPDGSQIAYTSSVEGQKGIYVVNPDGSQNQNLLSDTSILEKDEVTAIEWSPDGKLILFATSKDEIYVMRSDGSNLTRVANPTMLIEPHWAPEAAGAVWAESMPELAPAGTPTPTTTAAAPSAGMKTYDGKYASLFTFQYPPDIELIELENGDLMLVSKNGSVMQWMPFNWTFDHEGKDEAFKDNFCKSYATEIVLPEEQKTDPSASILRAGWLSGQEQGYCQIQIKSKDSLEVVYFFNAPMDSKIQNDRTKDQIIQTPRVTFMLDIFPGKDEDPDTVFMDTIQSIRFVK